MATPRQVQLSLAIQSLVLEDEASLRDVPDARLYDCLAIVQAWKEDLVTEAQYRARSGEESQVRQALSRERAHPSIPERV